MNDTREFPAAYPRARTEHLVVQALDDEVLVYDGERHRATCLNALAAAVWERCDGLTTPASIAASIAEEQEGTVPEAAVIVALAQLDRAHLLDVAPLRGSAPASSSRRALLKNLGVAAAAVPLVTSMAVPAAAQSGSCFLNGSGCTSGVQCCSGLCAPVQCEPNGRPVLECVPAGTMPVDCTDPDNFT